MTHPELEKIAGTLRQFSFPKKFAVEVTSECNLQCVMCHQPSMLRRKGVMPFELWQKCADEIALVSPGTECWFSFCGEPLLEPELTLRMLAYGRWVGIESLNLNTNGMLLEPELADPVLDSGVDLVVFGIDGFSSSTYEGIRCGGNREKLYANIEHFLAARLARPTGPDVQVQFIEMEENLDEVEQFKSYWLARGAAVKIRRKLSWGARIDSPLDVPQDRRIPCPWAINLMHVFWDGRVPRCSGDTEGDHCVGNAWKESLCVLWERLGAYRQLHLERRFDELPDRCQRCKDWMTGAAERVRPSGPSADPRNRLAKTSS